MSPFIKLQWAIDNYYSEQKYGIKKNLSDSDKQKTSVIVHFESGSTVASSSFYDILNQLGTELINKMDSTEAVIAFLGVAAILGGSWVLKAHINRLAEKDRLEANSRTLIEMSKQETERAKIIAEAASHNPTLQRRVDDISIVNDKLLKSLKPGEQLVQDGQVLIDGSSAKELTKPASKAEPIEDRLDGKFLTITVDSGSVRDGFRMTIRNIETKEVLTNVKVPAGTLTDEQVQTLQAGEWGKKPLFMQLNVRKSGNRNYQRNTD